MKVETLALLLLLQPVAPGFPAHVAAASGLACSGSWLHVVADDSLSLATFPLAGGPGESHPLFVSPPLALDPTERKREKPDLESLTVVPWQGGHGLLALGSGSSPRRRRGVLQALDPQGRAVGPALVFDAAPLLQGLPFDEVNIEGLAVVQERLFLGQRGNGRAGENALIELSLPLALQALREQRPWSPDLIRQIRPLHLGERDGVPLTLTDLAADGEEHLLILAAAEDTTNPYDDGEVKGSAIGRYRLRDGHGEMLSLPGSAKVEGIVRLGPRLLAVTDDDHPEQPARLLEISDLPDHW